MNIKRLLLAIVVGFVFIFATDFLIHGIWLAGDYKATASMWRPESDMTARFGWMLAAQFLCAVTFVLLYAKGFAERNCIWCACLFGLLMGLFTEVNTIIGFVVSPMPATLALKWFFSGIVQAVLLGAVTFAVYKPTTITTEVG